MPVSHKCALENTSGVIIFGGRCATRFEARFATSAPVAKPGFACGSRTIHPSSRSASSSSPTRFEAVLRPKESELGPRQRTRARKNGFSEPADIARGVNAADRGAEGPIKAGRSPPLRRVGINDCGNLSTGKGEYYVSLLVIERLVAPPGSLKVFLSDCRTEFCDEPLHRNHLIMATKKTLLYDNNLAINRAFPKI